MNVTLDLDMRAADGKIRRDLFLASGLMLFTEIALIRWLGENVLYLSFFTNFILLASFLGIGVGFLRATQDLGWFRWSVPLLFALLALVHLFPVDIDRSAQEVLFLGSGKTRGLPIWVVLPFMFILTTAVMATIGHGVGRLFAQLRPLTAYHMDILGSVVGVIGFASLSYLQTPPLVSGLILVGVCLFLLREQRGAVQLLAGVGILLILGAQTFNPIYRWSPYYQIATLDLDEVISISVNQIPHQAMATTDYLREVGWVATRTFELLEIEGPDDVLIVGAGTGNDVALALEAGARHIDAVEIDPGIYEQGRRLHPNRPYDETDRVSVHIDDGRAFVERSEKSYDFILFALTDSLTVVSGQSSLRLESYLFTEESVEATRDLLTDDGVLAFYNLHSHQWVIDRMGRTLQEVSGQRPCFRQEPGVRGVTLAIGNVEDVCDGGTFRDFSTAPQPATDDYPFLYIQERGIPSFYLVAIGAILVASLVAVRIGVPRISSIRPFADLFFMGTAFLLLETKAVVQFALWFGTTWVVNAIVFASILVSVLLAIEVVERFRVPSFPVLYTLLGLALLAAWLIPADLLLGLPIVARVVAAAALTFTPVFLANVIFAERFKDVSSSTVAFGANLLGAMVGGLLEYASLIVGYRGLTIVVGLLYATAFLLLRRQQAVTLRAAPVG